MPDDFAPSRPRAVPCVPRHPSVPATAGPRETDEQAIDTRVLMERDGHRLRLAAVASGGGRGVCTCGWQSPVSDDGGMFGEGFYGADHIRDDWLAHVDSERPAVVTRFLDGSAAPAPPPPDELEQARQARDLLNRLRAEKKIAVRGKVDGVYRLLEAPIEIFRLDARPVVYDEVPLP